MSSLHLVQSLGEAAKASSNRSPKPLKQLHKMLDSLKTKQTNGKSLSVQELYTAAFSAREIGDYFWRGPHKDLTQVKFGL